MLAFFFISLPLCSSLGFPNFVLRLVLDSKFLPSNRLIIIPFPKRHKMIYEIKAFHLIKFTNLISELLQILTIRNLWFANTFYPYPNITGLIDFVPECSHWVCSINRVSAAERIFVPAHAAHWVWTR